MITHWSHYGKRYATMIPAAIVVMLAGNFLYQALFHHNGLLTLITLESEQLRIGKELSTVIDERRSWEDRVNAMRDETMDPDMADEQARRLLGVVREDEIVIILPPKKQPHE